jgi:hypothetical protein
MNRRNQVLSVLLAFQVAVAVVVFYPRSSGGSQKSGPLLANFTPDNVVQVTITDTGGVPFVLDKNDAGNWVVPSAGDYPVKPGQMEQMLGRIEGLQANRLIANSPSSHSRLKVSDKEFERLIELKYADGKQDRLYIGSAAGANATHMRVNGEAAVYLVGGLASYEAPAQIGSWVDLQYVSVSSDAVVSLKLESPNGVFEFNKVGDEWQLSDLAEGETFNPDGFTTLLNRATSVRMSKPISTTLDDSFGIDAPQAIITVTTQEEQPITPTATSVPGILNLATPTVGAEATASAPVETVEKTVTLTIGAKLDNNNYVAISSESTYYVELSSTTAEEFLNLTRDDFLVLPPEATATPETTGTPEVTPETSATPEATASPEITPEASVTPEASETLEVTPEATTTPQITPEATATPEPGGE